MTEDQLKTMEASAPLLVAEVRRLQAFYQNEMEVTARLTGQLRAETLALEEANKKLRTIHEALAVLVSAGIKG